MQRILGWVLGLSILLLTACGGGGGNGGTCTLCGDGGSGGGTDTSTSTVTSLRIELSSATIANLSPAPVTVTVTAVNANNIVVGSVPVVVKADNGGVVTSNAASTDATGTVTSTVGMGADSTARTITVTATSGTITASSQITVVNSVSGGSATLALDLSSSTVTATAPSTVSVTLLDANGRAVPSAVVSFSSLGGLGKFSSTGALTDVSGKASVLLYPASSTAGADYVVASANVNGTAVSTNKGFQTNATSVGIQSLTAGATGRLSAYGQTTVTVTLSGTVPGTPVGLSVASLCAAKSKASITPATLTTTNGTAIFTYKDAQCGATDNSDKVTVTVDGTSTTGSVDILLTQPKSNSIGFVSASPEVIYLKGSGFGETSVVTFVVNDQVGNALPGQLVAMLPTTTVGGLSMVEAAAIGTPFVASSDSSGRVAVHVNSGTIPTPARVKAALRPVADPLNPPNPPLDPALCFGTTVPSDCIFTVSSNLSVAVGLPSQLNFSLAQKTINIEGLNVDGTTNTYTVIASDRMGNPVPAGTTVNFVAEGSQIQSQGFTTMSSGLASTTVNFQSSEPRPKDGRVTIVAYALGEESFVDVNGNNVWDGGASAEAYQDLGAVFLSRKFSDKFNPAQSDQFIKGDGNTACIAPSNALLNLDASIPSKGDACDAVKVWTNTGYVRRAIETVLSSSNSRLMWFSGGPGVGVLDSGCAVVNESTTGNIVISDDGFNTDNGGVPRTASFRLLGAGNLYGLPLQGSLSFLVSDANPNRLNPMPAGTTISASATQGISVSVGGGSPVANTSSVTGGLVGFKFTEATSGTIFITTTTPKGVGTSYAINVDMAALPAGASACTK